MAIGIDYDYHLQNVQVDSVFPKDTIKAAFRSFLITGSINLISIGSGNAALVAGSIAATATLIESVVRAIFNISFPMGGFDQQNWTTFLIACPLTNSLSVTPLQNLIGCVYKPSDPLLRMLANFFIWANDSLEANESFLQHEIRFTVKRSAQVYAW
jgi:hypothetical protein